MRGEEKCDKKSMLLMADGGSWRIIYRDARNLTTEALEKFEWS